MSALLDQLAQNGVSTEDLEKAASVELFLKVAAAEGFDLDAMNQDQVNELYAQFETEVLPGMTGEPSVEDKLASLSEDDVVFLFEKQAAYEGYSEADLQSIDDEKLAAAFGHFVEEILPEMAANDFEPVDMGGSDKVAEAQAKLAEAQILGTHMADTFHQRLDELGTFDKMAGIKETAGAAWKGLKSVATAEKARKGYEQMKKMKGIAGRYQGRRVGERAAHQAGRARTKMLKGIGQTAGLYGGGAAALGGGALAASKMRKKEASALDTLVEARAIEILEANGYSFG